ncbi:MAG: class I SAM-dependent methyltransferase [Methanomicrobiales archaeon]|nr:class I SAM-dependent methyltransferase [Methanomicrobiales archaeon]
MNDEKPAAADCGDAASAIDWNRIWQARKKASRQSQRGSDASRRWERREQAERYAHDVDAVYETRISETLSLLTVRNGMSVLDIGSGPGTLAVPLAERGARVTAVEPAAGMAALLHERAAQAGCGPVAVVRKRWEDVDPAADLAAPYDLVVASFSLAMDDIGAAVRKMDEAASGGVYLFWFAGEPLWERMYRDLWDELHGVPYCPGPKADCLINLLFQMGIAPSVLMAPLEKSYRFDGFDEAVAFFGPRFGVSDARQEHILRRYLADRNQSDGGGFALAATTMYASIWWEKKPRWPSRFFSAP